ncbi:hypothetical protein MMSR116_18315 [Methylobacterium mesophilicum SR1.6/6]|uniref:HEPN AbiU2-like domain-containing protein n=1 Tax=Methylobacterium mesophilicum SR1.6/6 TaxID=908290 RepID=A0A6B9FRN3_9HYPH|nr:hypothetical protein [Methylobacterium mesophilicum]QGY03625.1 hypothetical protein MMSR116_18315 [Methylobacterium mesophilicum SR1.6/6]
MKFQIGDATDTALCVALKHEFLRCDNAFNDFSLYARMMIASNGGNRRISYKTYDAYARFIHHLYEFLMGGAVRDFQNTEQIRAEMAHRIVAGETQRIVTNRRNAILDGTAPDWENDISYYPEKIPPEFAEEFRKARNKTFGHVSIERSTLDLSAFYDRYHKFLYLLYYDIRSWWGRYADEFPDLKEITDFSVMVKDDPPPEGAYVQT